MCVCVCVVLPAGSCWSGCEAPHGLCSILSPASPAASQSLSAAAYLEWSVGSGSPCAERCSAAVTHTQMMMMMVRCVSVCGSLKLRDAHLIRKLLQTSVSRVSAADAVSRSHDGADALPLNRAIHLPALVLTGVRHLLITHTHHTKHINNTTQHKPHTRHINNTQLNTHTTLNTNHTHTTHSTQTTHTHTHTTLNTETT